MPKHIDGGLTNTRNAPHVLAAVQALLHCSAMVDFILDDLEHRESCKSLLCMCCALFKLYDEIEKRGIGNPTTFVHKWNDVSKMMSAADRSSPLKVLEIFIDKLRFEQVDRNDE
ncbi:uncharacterized protein LOC117642017 [Thrips palmi]|uniref:Uncharacterized protein LOC117642017 n=1 Tax=Thrips palmi TaxID=161013 RepID=A0A6P8Y7S8_THRPL|nr:uncharacterized protein LOC117642017 [Thrips palmi]